MSGTTNEFDLSGKVALVTGGNSGIGLGIAEALAQAGAAVAVWGTNPEKNARAVDHLASYGVTVHAERCDVGDEEAVDAAMEGTVSVLGRVDACFANAGVSGMAPSFTEMPTEEWRRVLRVNLDGAFFTLRAASRHMVERGGGGSLVATSSLASIEGQARGQHYAATKGALNAMVKALAVELARHDVRANAILPGWFETEMASPLLNWDRFRERVLPRVPARRWGRPEDLGGLAVYLASDASSYHTGDVLLVDGGYSIF